ncbi:lytic murein transglycosylase [Desulfosoma caldarium]|uniref:Membrane-bound lytic murein transglycosylase B n=1 Tax=Desulfosoma caldarium TaxID=610254 RepID=A0A3N1UMC0_9BACT|nr:lytic murein transglycosylase [Desulfosoma caldarium]ROQ92345.1 membrane-bound lytic murein transglycosylase B [Desulfosoma caldarium]
MLAPSFRSWKPACVSLVVAASVIFSGLAPRSVHAKEPLDRVRRLLEAEGCSRHALSVLFSSAESPAYGNVALSMKIRETALNYEAFLDPSSLAKAEQFWRLHDETLHRIGAAYEVDPSIIVAILLVESALGERTGNHPVATTLATFALMLDPDERERVWGMLSAQDRARWARDRFHARLERRASWALNELRALVTLIDRGMPEAAQWRGSYMAAVGWPQFLPSSLLHYGADGDGDGTVDLNRPEDAFASIAKYLKSHGWRNDAVPEQQEKVVLKYNNSRPYARTVLEAARRLRDLRIAEHKKTSTSTPAQALFPDPSS